MPGRFEVLGYQPLVIVDGAHNPPGADTCAEVFFDDFNPDGRRILVVGTLREPTVDARGAARRRVRRRHRLHRPVAPWHPACRRSPARPSPSAATRCSPPTPSSEACALAMRGADGDDAVLAAGSLYVAGAARPALVELSP